MQSISFLIGSLLSIRNEISWNKEIWMKKKSSHSTENLSDLQLIEQKQTSSILR